ncbi:uncharacterized protein ARMOST_05819 [Armillaria ostoyae]|uniref:Uncharacterized protein n=1 Tax=Armillaria ostoyae TaxID=47428 RepID=A0A284R1A0_ARMOS|nr:uncharacterized protein ARMOST_05819 [Armillaria ostoyae]
MTTIKTANTGEMLGSREYKYTQEISQMMFVFGEVQEPNMDTIVQARALAVRRGARYLTSEDLIFLIRHDRGKVNRIRTYLSWKDVRRHAKDSDGVEVETLEDGADDEDKLAAKAQKITIKLPWEITTIYSEVLKQSGHQSDDEEDEDDIEAHEASMQLLKAIKRFREFLNLPPHLDLKANDDTVDIVGFLAFEMVRSLTLAGLSVKKSLEEASLLDEYTSPVMGKRTTTSLGGSAEKRRRERDEYTLPVNSLFLPPPEARIAIQPEHIQDAFSRMQGDWSHRRAAGMHNWRGGLVRTRVTLI